MWACNGIFMIHSTIEMAIFIWKEQKMEVRGRTFISYWSCIGVRDDLIAIRGPACHQYCMATLLSGHYTIDLLTCKGLLLCFSEYVCSWENLLKVILRYAFSCVTHMSQGFFGSIVIVYRCLPIVYPLH